MGNVRGLRTRLCPKCGEITPHRTLYAKTESGGRSKWFQLFWACTKCDSLNHVVLPRYRLESPSHQLPSTMAIGVVNALRERPLDFAELIAGLKRSEIPGVHHVFNSEVLMALKYLRGRGVITEEASDRTVRTLDVLRARPAESKHLGSCPAEQSQGTIRKTLISLYAQKRKPTTQYAKDSSFLQKRLVPVGVFCLHCEYQRVDAGSAKEPRPTEQQAPRTQHP